MQNQSLAREIWQTLSAIDVSQHTEKKKDLTYLSWAWAWSVMCDHFPDTMYEFSEFDRPDGTVMVECTVTVSKDGQSVARTMWLPVMDYRNKAIPNPDSFQVNTARMRCLTKCLSMLGLGIYIYAGEDLPKAVQEAQNSPITADQVAILAELLQTTDSDIERFCKAFKCESVETMLGGYYDQALEALRRKFEKQRAEQEADDGAAE